MTFIFDKNAIKNQFVKVTTSAKTTANAEAVVIAAPNTHFADAYLSIPIRDWGNVN